MVNSLKDQVEEAIHAITTLEEKLRSLLSVVEKNQEALSEYYYEVTWVKNKAGEKYYYAYLKSKTRRPSSIYLGKASQEKRKAIELSKVFRKIEESLVAIQELRECLQEVREAFIKIKDIEPYLKTT